MKIPALFVPVLVCAVGVASSLVFGQQKKSRPVSKEFIEVAGVKLRLGMTKVEVADKFADVPDVRKVSERSWLIDRKTETWPSSVQFKNGVLVFADRGWRTKETDAVQALFGVIGSLNREGYSECKIDSDTLTHPGEVNDRVWIHCGRKTVLVVHIQMGDKTFEEVIEQLGTMPEDE